MTKTLLDESVHNYLDWLKNIKKASYQTFRAYQVDLIQFLKYFLRAEQNYIPSKQEIEDYLGVMKEKYNYSSYRRKVTVLRNFIKHLVDSGIIVHDPFISISLPMPEVNFNLPVSYEEIIVLINSFPEYEVMEVRDKIIFSLIAKCGLTIKQLLKLKVKDINLAAGQIIISSSQLAFLDKSIVSLIEKYFSLVNREAPIALDDYLIANHFKNGKIPLSTRTINLVIDKTARKMKFRARLSPAILRRLFAKNLTEKNVNKSVKELILGKTCTLAT